MKREIYIKRRVYGSEDGIHAEWYEPGKHTVSNSLADVLVEGEIAEEMKQEKPKQIVTPEDHEPDPLGSKPGTWIGERLRSPDDHEVTVTGVEGPIVHLSDGQAIHYSKIRKDYRAIT